MKVLITSNQLDDLGIAFHLLYFSKCPRTCKWHIEPNTFKNVDWHKSKPKSFLMLIWYRNYMSMSSRRSSLIHINKIIIILTDITCTFKNLRNVYYLIKYDWRIRVNVSYDVRITAWVDCLWECPSCNPCFEFRQATNRSKCHCWGSTLHAIKKDLTLEIWCEDVLLMNC